MDAEISEVEILKTKVADLTFMLNRSVEINEELIELNNKMEKKSARAYKLYMITSIFYVSFCSYLFIQNNF